MPLLLGDYRHVTVQRGLIQRPDSLFGGLRDRRPGGQHARELLKFFVHSGKCGEGSHGYLASFLSRGRAGAPASLPGFWTAASIRSSLASRSSRRISIFVNRWARLTKSARDGMLSWPRVR